MKKLFLSVLALLAIFLFVGCKKDDNLNEYDKIPDTMQADSYEIAFVTDIGQLKDKSFNQGTWEGVKKYAHDNGKSYKYYQPANANDATDDDRYDAMAAAAKGGAKIIVCAGFMQGNALTRAAAEFKDVKFVFIDGWALGMENVTAIIFQEEQSGYLAGYAAVKEGYTKLGFSGGGGGTNPACQRFGYGFIQGANDAAKELEKTVDMKYSWAYGADFTESADLQAMLEGWYSNGTQIVFSCGGSMCKSAFSAAAANNGKVIGVDVDQSAESKTVITSATKGLREGTMHALKQFFDGKWAEISDKTVNLGAKDSAVGLPTAEGSWGFKKFTVKEYNTLFEKLQKGEVTVDADVKEAGYVEGLTFSNVNLEVIK